MQEQQITQMLLSALENPESLRALTANPWAFLQAHGVSSNVLAAANPPRKLPGLLEEEDLVRFREPTSGVGGP